MDTPDGSGILCMKLGSRRRAKSLSSLQETISLDDDLVPLRNRAPPPSGPEIDRIQYHIGLRDFGIDLQKAANAIFPGEQNSRYTKVDVILLSWEDEDFNLPVSVEIQELHDIFTGLYGYNVEQWHIPGDDCHNKLQAKILQFLGDSDPRHLKIVYYAGHGKLTNHHQLAWTSWRNNGNDRCPTVKWSGIQNTLEESRSDVLILLDCCAAGICTSDEGNGVTELIAACAYNAIANPVGPYSFTHALNAKLRQLVQRPDFTIGLLYNAIFTEIQGQRHQDQRYKKAPIHLVLSQNQELPRSIRLSNRLTRKSKAKIGASPCPLAFNPNTSHLTDQSSSSGDSHLTGNGVSTPALSTSSSMTSLTSFGEIQQYPRLLFSIRIDEDVKSKNLSTELFSDWLRDIPVPASFVRVEAGFASDSTLVMVSMPVAMLGYLSNNSAITLLGTIRSQNLMSIAPERPVATTEVPAKSQIGMNFKFPLSPVMSRPASFQGTIPPRPKHSLEASPSQRVAARQPPPLITQEYLYAPSPEKVSPKSPITGLADSFDVVDLAQELREDSKDLTSDDETENSFIDDYSIGDMSDTETITTCATTYDRSSVTPLPRSYSDITPSEYTTYTLTPKLSRQFSYDTNPTIQPREDEELKDKAEIQSATIPTVTISKWGDMHLDDDKTAPTTEKPLLKPVVLSADKGKEKERSYDGYSYLSMLKKGEEERKELTKMDTGDLPLHMHECTTCKVNGRETAVLWGDMCRSCGTNC